MSAAAVANPEDDEKLQSQYAGQLGQFAAIRLPQQPQQQTRSIADPTNAASGGGDTPIAPVIARRSVAAPATVPTPTAVSVTRRGPIPETLPTTLSQGAYSSGDLLPAEDAETLPAMQRNSLPLVPQPAPKNPGRSSASLRPGDASQYEATSPEYGSDTPTLGQIGDKWYTIATGKPYDPKKSTSSAVKNYIRP